MKLSVREIAESEKGWATLGKLAVPARISFKISRLMKKVIPEIENYHEARNNVLKKYGESVDGNSYTIKKEMIESYQKEIDDLIKSEIELEFEPIKLSEIESCSIEPNALNSLGRFISEG